MESTQYIGNQSFELITLLSKAPLKRGEVRLKWRIGVCGTDVHIYHGKMDAEG
jgi:threonine dehydrogenase-like Zn-dependent dehydrogenase